MHLHAKLTEIGTLELWCSEIGGERTWRLQFDVRSATQTDAAAHACEAEQQGFVDEGSGGGAGAPDCEGRSLRTERMTRAR